MSKKGRVWAGLMKLISEVGWAATVFLAFCFLVPFVVLALLFWPKPSSQVDGCKKVSTFALGVGESKALALKDGTPVVVVVASADASGGSGTLKVGERSEPVVFYPSSVEERNGVSLGMIGSNTSGTRSSLNLVVADCSSPVGAK
jgi:hypothetical protein